MTKNQNYTKRRNYKLKQTKLMSVLPTKPGLSRPRSVKAVQVEPERL